MITKEATSIKDIRLSPPGVGLHDPDITGRGGGELGGKRASNVFFKILHFPRRLTGKGYKSNAIRTLPD